MTKAELEEELLLLRAERNHLKSAKVDFEDKSDALLRALSLISAVSQTDMEKEDIVEAIKDLADYHYSLAVDLM